MYAVPVDAGFMETRTGTRRGNTGGPNSYGFRPERSTADAIEQCFNILAKRASPEWILEGDIRGCFDNFSHSWFLEHIPMDKVILRKWLQAGYIDEGTRFETRAGTPKWVSSHP